LYQLINHLDYFKDSANQKPEHYGHVFCQLWGLFSSSNVSKNYQNIKCLRREGQMMGDNILFILTCLTSLRYCLYMFDIIKILFIHVWHH
jgi:hypothetical protein